MNEQMRSKINIWSVVQAGLSLLGAAIAVYATRHHLNVKAFGLTDAVCNINSSFNCDEIANSAYSEIFNIPVAIFGLGYFVAMFALAMTAKISKKYQDATQSYFAASLAALVGCVALFVISLTMVKVLCPTCLATYAVVILQVALTPILFKGHPELWKMKSWSKGSLQNGLSTAALIVAVVVVGFNAFKSSFAPRKQMIPEEVLQELKKGGETAEKSNFNPNISQTVNEIKIDRSPYSGYGEDFRFGANDAKVVVVEFSDFQCPACKGLSEVVKQFKNSPSIQGVQFVFKNYPLDMNCNPKIEREMHKFACKAALIGRCAGQAGKFWEFHDMVFEKQSDLSDATLFSIAEKLGIHKKDAEACLNSKDLLTKIRDDISAADKLGVDGTPTIFINGRRYQGGRSYAELSLAIKQFLNE